MAVLRITRRWAGLLLVALLITIIFLVGPPKAPAGDAPGAPVNFTLAYPTDQLVPDSRLPAVTDFHRIQTGVWARGNSARDLPVLHVTTSTATSDASTDSVLAAAIDHELTELRRVGFTIAGTTSMVFGGMPGASIEAERAGLSQTIWIGIDRQTLLTASVLHAPGAEPAAAALLGSLRSSSKP